MTSIKIKINLQLDGVNLVLQNIDITPDNKEFPSEFIIKNIVESLERLGVNKGDDYYRAMILRLMGVILKRKDPEDYWLLLEAAELLKFKETTQESLDKLAQPSKLVDLIAFSHKALKLLENPGDDLNYASIKDFLDKGIDTKLC